MTSSVAAAVPAHHPAALRNRVPIWDVLSQKLFSTPNPTRPLSVLEIASGTGAQTEYFAANTSPAQAVWQPSERDSESLPALRQTFSAPSFAHVKAPIVLDLLNLKECELETKFDVVYMSNVTHIAPFAATQNFFRELVPRALLPGGVVAIYGPFKKNGQFTTESNAEFDANLKERDASWGYRDVSELAELGAAAGLSLTDVLDMPANNFMLWFVLRGEGRDGRL